MENKHDLEEKELAELYTSNMQSDIPDIWDRINSGIDEIEKTPVSGTAKVTDISKKKTEKTKHHRKYSALIAAAVVLAVIIPTWIFWGGKSKLNDSETEIYEETDNSDAPDMMPAEDTQSNAENYPDDSEIAEDYESAVFEFTVQGIITKEADNYYLTLSNYDDLSGDYGIKEKLLLVNADEFKDELQNIVTADFTGTSKLVVSLDYSKKDENDDYTPVTVISID